MVWGDQQAIASALAALDGKLINILILLHLMHACALIRQLHRVEPKELVLSSTLCRLLFWKLKYCYLENGCAPLHLAHYLLFNPNISFPSSSPDRTRVSCRVFSSHYPCELCTVGSLTCHSLLVSLNIRPWAGFHLHGVLYWHSLLWHLLNLLWKVHHYFNVLWFASFGDNYEQ